MLVSRSALVLLLAQRLLAEAVTIEIVLLMAIVNNIHEGVEAR